jgi:hypothetical protein
VRLISSPSDSASLGATFDPVTCKTSAPPRKSAGLFCAVSFRWPRRGYTRISVADPAGFGVITGRLTRPGDWVDLAAVGNAVARLAPGERDFSFAALGPSLC